MSRERKENENKESGHNIKKPESETVITLHKKGTVQNTDQMSKSQNTNQMSIDNLMVKRDNRLIKGKSNGTLFERKLISLALSQLRVTPKGELVSELYAYEIRQQLGITGGSLYDKLREVSVASVQRYVFLDDVRGPQNPQARNMADDDGHFEVVGMVSKASYRNGKFSLVFNPELKYLVAQIKGPFTSISWNILKKFKHLVSLRCYEILKVEAYKIKDGRPVEVTYGLGELKFLLGLVPLDKKTETQLRNGMSYDAILSEMKDREPYRDWRNLRRALLMAVKEINEYTDLNISFDGRRSGVGGKVVAVTFYITKSKAGAEAEKAISSIEEKDILYLLEYSCGDFTKQDVLLLLERADLTRIQAVYDSAKKQKKLRNLMGWMLSAIENGWDVSEKTPDNQKAPDKEKRKSSSRKNNKKGNFYNFEQRTYDWNSLERQLLERTVIPESAEDIEIEEDPRSFDITDREDDIVEEELPFPEPESSPSPDLSSLSLEDLDDDLKMLILDRLNRKKRNNANKQTD